MTKPGTKTDEGTINKYGDVFVPAGDPGYGGAISQQREDRLDAAALERASQLLASDACGRVPVAYDIGAGYGAMAMKFAAAGCTVVACDIAPMPALRVFAQQTGSILARHIIECDARDVEWAALPAPDVLYSQRFLHYLRFTDAVALVRSMVRPERECFVYLSMSGLKSELGNDYPAAPLQERFAYLTNHMRKKHGIAQKVCLYDLSDAESLARECDLEVVDLWRSDFGNVKLIAKH